MWKTYNVRYWRRKSCGFCRDKVAQVTRKQVREIAEIKMPDLNAASVEAAMHMIEGTARSMGFTVVDGRIVEIDAITDPARLRELDLAVLDD